MESSDADKLDCSAACTDVVDSAVEKTDSDPRIQKYNGTHEAKLLKTVHRMTRKK